MGVGVTVFVWVCGRCFGCKCKGGAVERRNMGKCLRT